MESKAAINLVFLDACRNNPLADNLRRSLTAQHRSAALGRGLAKVEPTGHDTLRSRRHPARRRRTASVAIAHSPPP